MPSSSRSFSGAAPSSATRRSSCAAIPTAGSSFPCLPPCAVGDLLWHPRHSADAYPVREDFVRRLRTGSPRGDPRAIPGRRRRRFSSTSRCCPASPTPETYGLEPDLASLQAAVELSVETIGEVAKGLDGIFFSVHPVPRPRGTEPGDPAGPGTYHGRGAKNAGGPVRHGVQQPGRPGSCSRLRSFPTTSCWDWG